MWPRRIVKEPNVIRAVGDLAEDVHPIRLTAEVRGGPLCPVESLPPRFALGGCGLRLCLPPLDGVQDECAARLGRSAGNVPFVRIDAVVVEVVVRIELHGGCGFRTRCTTPEHGIGEQVFREHREARAIAEDGESLRRIHHGDVVRRAFRRRLGTEIRQLRVAVAVDTHHHAARSVGICPQTHEAASADQFDRTGVVVEAQLRCQVKLDVVVQVEQKVASRSVVVVRSTGSIDGQLQSAVGLASRGNARFRCRPMRAIKQAVIQRPDSFHGRQSRQLNVHLIRTDRLVVVARDFDEIGLILERVKGDVAVADVAAVVVEGHEVAAAVIHAHVAVQRAVRPRDVDRHLALLRRLDAVEIVVADQVGFDLAGLLSKSVRIQSDRRGVGSLSRLKAEYGGIGMIVRWLAHADRVFAQGHTIEGGDFQVIQIAALRIERDLALSIRAAVVVCGHRIPAGVVHTEERSVGDRRTVDGERDGPVAGGGDLEHVLVSRGVNGRCVRIGQTDTELSVACAVDRNRRGERADGIDIDIGVRARLPDTDQVLAFGRLAIRVTDVEIDPVVWRGHDVGDLQMGPASATASAVGVRVPLKIGRLPRGVQEGRETGRQGNDVDYHRAAILHENPERVLVERRANFAGHHNASLRGHHIRNSIRPAGTGVVVGRIVGAPGAERVSARIAAGR